MADTDFVWVVFRSDNKDKSALVPLLACDSSEEARKTVITSINKAKETPEGGWVVNLDGDSWILTTAKHTYNLLKLKMKLSAKAKQLRDDEITDRGTQTPAMRARLSAEEARARAADAVAKREMIAAGMINPDMPDEAVSYRQNGYGTGVHVAGEGDASAIREGVVHAR